MSDTTIDPPDQVGRMEIEKRLGRPLSEAELIMAEALIDDGWLALLYEVPTLEARCESDPRLYRLAGSILMAAVTRVVRNPEGWRQIGLDDFQGTRDTVLSGGVIRFTDEELERLAVRRVSLPPMYSLGFSVPYWSN